MPWAYEEPKTRKDELATMLRKPLNLASRLGAGTILAAALAGGVVAMSPSAGAAVSAYTAPALGPTCHATVVYSVTSTEISASIYTLCPLQSPKLIPDAVTISKLENGQWVVVASGTGNTVYTCKGSTENEFAVADDIFDAACG
jgi:hypothetical protein